MKITKIMSIIKNHFLLNYTSIVRNEIVREKWKREAIDNKSCGVDTNSDFVVSLTTFGNRINCVHLTIASLLKQTLKPYDLVLWLDEDEFNKDNIPIVLKEMVSRGLSIKYTHNIRSYKKLIPTLQLYPEKTIITVDDDILYPETLTENLVKMHNKYPECIIYNLGSKITFDKNKRIRKYNDWEENCINDEPSSLFLAIGVGGVLYPPYSLDKEILNENKFMQLAPYADDLWFKAMALKRGTRYIHATVGQVIYRNNFLDFFVPIEDVQLDKLSLINVIKGQNDVQFRAIMDEYKLWGKLKD